MKRFKLLEAKSIEAEYNSNWSVIPKDVFDEIILLDPQTNVEKQTIGPNAKQLLLPKYIAGETTFLDNREAVKDAIDKFIKNRSEYEIKNIALYPSVESFVKHIEDPENNPIIADEVEEESKIDKIYNQYYKDIDKEDFLYIISLDPETNIEKGNIGKYAKNFLLRLYKTGVSEVADKDFKDKIIASINYIEKNKNTLDKKWSSLNTLTDFNEFIELPNFIEDSELLKYLKNSKYWDDIEYIGSTQKHDIFVPKNYVAAAAIAGADDKLSIPGTNLRGPGITPESGSTSWARNLYAHWCTTQKKYWTEYNEQGQKYYNFMARGANLYSNERRNNYQLAIKPDGSINNGGVADGYEDYAHPAVIRPRLFAEDPDIINILAKEDGYAGNMAEVKITRIVKKQNGTFIYKGKAEYDEFFSSFEKSDQKILKGLFTKLIIDADVKEIHSSAFVNWGIKEISFNNGLEVIGVDAFRNCGSIKRLKFPESLKEIKGWAFYGCINLKNTVTIPNNVTYIGRKAFADTDLTLSILSDRTHPINVDEKDKPWLAKHTRLVNVTNEELLDEKLPKDLEKIYKASNNRVTPKRSGSETARQAEIRLFGNPLSREHHTDFHFRRGVEFDYENAEYKELSKEEATRFVKEHPDKIDQLRLIINNELVEYWYRKDKKAFYCLYGNTNNPVYVDGKEYNNVRFLSPANAIKIAEKIYWTDEYDHPLNNETSPEIIARRNNNNKIINRLAINDPNTIMNYNNSDYISSNRLRLNNTTNIDPDDIIELPEEPDVKYSLPNIKLKNAFYSGFGEVDTGSHKKDISNYTTGWYDDYPTLNTYMNCFKAKSKAYKEYKATVKALNLIIENKNLYSEASYEERIKKLTDKKEDAFTKYKKAYDNYIKAKKSLLTYVDESTKKWNKYITILYIRKKKLKELSDVCVKTIRDAQEKLRDKNTVDISTDPDYKKQLNKISAVNDSMNQALTTIDEYNDEIEKLTAKIKEFQNKISNKNQEIDELNIQLISEQQQLDVIAEEVVNKISDEIDKLKNTIDENRKQLAKWGIQKYTPSIEKEMPQELDKMFSFGDNNKDEEEDN